SDEFVLGHAVDDGREGGRRPGGGRLGVGDEFVDGGQSGAEPTAGEDLVDVALPNAEVFAEGPIGAHDRGPGDEEPFEDVLGSLGAGIEVDAALGAADGNVVATLPQVDGLFAGHALGQAAHFVEGAALAHAQTARGGVTDEGVDDDEAVGSGDWILPGDVHEQSAPPGTETEIY